MSGAGTNGAGLIWSSLSSTNAYTVQTRDSVTEGVWVPAPSTQPWPIAETNWSDPRPASNQSRFYRVLGVTAPQRGRLLKVTLQTTLTAAQVTFYLSQAGYQTTVPYGAVVRKLDYETVNPDGGKILASGLLVVPPGLAKALPLVCYQHGTIVQTNQVPSSTLYGEAIVGLGYAGTGYAAVLPDYLGLGDSPAYHPYVHARTEATAAIDLLRAARTWCATNSIALNGQLFLLGYSQGGHAAMSLHREIETFHTNEFTITASAPMAGPYDLSGATTADFLKTGKKIFQKIIVHFCAKIIPQMRFLNTILNSLLNVIFPVKCVACGETGPELCLACLSEVPPAERESATWIFPIYDYRHPGIKKSLWFLKYKGKKRLS